MQLEIQTLKKLKDETVDTYQNPKSKAQEKANPKLWACLSVSKGCTYLKRR
jgi:hypothetical protein